MDARKRLIDQNIETAWAHMRSVLADPASAPDHLTVIPLSILTLAGGRNGLTPGRVSLLAQLRAHGEYGRMQDLADAVGRDKFAVSKDIDVLSMLGLVHKRRTGRTVAIAADARPIMLA